MQQNITQPREKRQCVPEAKYLVRQDGVGATVGTKLQYVVLSEPQAAMTTIGSHYMK